MEAPQSANEIEPLLVPHGLAEIIAAFGDIYKYVRPDGQLDPRWQTDFLARIRLPFPLRLAWDVSQTIDHMTCHRRMTSVYAAVFDEIQQRGLQKRVSTFGACFAFRSQRTGSKLSAHSWGIAIDLNPGSNLQGSPGDMDAGLVEIFRCAGFAWGGDWEGKTRDPMHFQFCTGY